MMRSKRIDAGFTLIELVIVLAVLGALAAIAIPRVQGVSHDAEVKATARALSSAVNNHAARSYAAESEACGGVAYEYLGGKVCIQGEPGSSPVEPVSFSGFGLRNSEKLWNVFLGTPINTSTDDSGWVATPAGDCEGDTTFTYCWDYHASANNRVARIRYNNNGNAGIEIIPDEDL